MQILFASRINETNSLEQAKIELNTSVERSTKLYNSLFLLLIEIFHLAETKLEQAKNKMRPSLEDKNPNLKFVENKVLAFLKEEADIAQIIETHRYNLHESIPKRILADIMSSAEYNRYMSLKRNSIDDDRKMLNFILKNYFIESEQLDEILEDKSIYWNDEVEFIISLILQRVRKVTQKLIATNDYIDTEEFATLGDESDKKFALELLIKTFQTREKNYDIIKNQLINWDVERIAQIDAILIEMAMTELLHFPEIHTTVTLFEYVEISKYYSTEKSNTFINGVLDKMLLKFREEKLVTKP